MFISLFHFYLYFFFFFFYCDFIFYCFNVASVRINVFIMSMFHICVHVDALLAEWLWLPDMGVFASLCSAIICLPVAVCLASEAALADVSC